MEIAKIQVSGVTARRIYCNPIPRGITGATVAIEYADPMWEGLIKNVVFEGLETVTILDVENSVYLPPEVVSAQNILVKMGLCGVNADGTVVIPTLWAELGVIKSAVPVDVHPDDAIPDAPPTPPVWAQLQADMDTLEKEVDKLKKGSSGGLTVTDDGEGNVAITASGSTQITDDGSGNVVIS